MNIDTTGWITNVYGIVPDQGLRALLVAHSGPPALPQALLSDRVRPWSAGRVGSEVGELLGIALRPARWLLLEEDSERRNVDLAVVFDPPGAAPPPGWSWADSAAPLSGFGKRAANAWLGGRAEPVPDKRQPWAREGTGWFTDAVAWMDSSLAAAGITRTAPVEQVRSWSISCVLTAPTTDGSVFFKAAARLPLFVDEPVLTLRLAEWWPEESPEVIAIEHDQGWLLMRDFGPSVRMSLADAPEGSYAGAARMLAWAARRHQASASRTAELLAIGCHDRSIERTLSHSRTLLASELTAAHVDRHELARLHELEPRIEAACSALAGAGVPSVLVHGDLHLGNVAERNGHLVVFDWTDAAVAHPFADLLAWSFADEPAARAALAEAYLSAWPEAERRRLKGVWHLLPVYLQLYHAISYHELIGGIERIVPAEITGLRDHLTGLLAALEEM